LINSVLIKLLLIGLNKSSNLSYLICKISWAIDFF
jgi:hypothetical protein